MSKLNALKMAFFVGNIYKFNTACGLPQRNIYIYIYVWKLNQTVLDLDFWAVKFLYPAP